MRYFFLSLLMMIALTLEAQQDPIVIQTLTFDSITTRRGVFDFPDASQPWRKILMVHTLKCDKATTQDGYDCGEWDYLTYNKVYHNTGGMDSTALTHPYFLEGTAAPSSITLLQDPLYDRQVERYETPVLQHVGASMTSTVFPGITDQVYIPLTEGSPSARLQAIYTVQELQSAGLAAGPIRQLVWQDDHPEAEFFLTVRMALTTATQTDQVLEENWTTVLARPWTTIGEADSLLFNTDFIWDGTSNILVDLAFDRSGGQPYFALQGGDANLEQASLRTGPDGYVEFKGDSYITLPSDRFSQVKDQITICFWAKGADSQPFNSSILEATDEQGRRVLNIHFPWSNGQIYWDAGDGPNYDRINKQASESDYKNQWNHWAFVKNATTGSMKIYRNGQLWQSGTGMTRLIQTITSLTIGKGLTYDGPYQGSVDELMLFNVELPVETIRELMQYRLGPFAPYFDNLVYGSGFDRQLSAYPNVFDPQEAAIPLGPVSWKARKATDLTYADQAYTSRPTLGFVQGEYDLYAVEDTLHTLLPLPATSLVTFDIADHNPIGVDTIYGWEAQTTYLYDVTGEAIDSMGNGGGQLWTNDTLDYFSPPFEVIDEYEIGRYITPYGIGLTLGQGFSWVFDVTDYAPILQNQVDLSAGNNQELIDLKFLFYPGTPAREVQKIDRLWGGLKSHSYKNLDDDVALPPTEVTLLPTAESFKIKTRITGHGHNSNDGNYPHCCEWKNNTHTLQVDNVKVADWHVWQTHDCALNPVFPQGGTWPGAREGWCPGDLVKEHEFEITNYVSGQTATIDYSITPVPGNNLGMGGGNYVMDMQLLQYGPWAHQTDAEIYEILAPSMTQYYGRLNPICHDPRIILRNSGALNITQVNLTYGVSGGNEQTYTWTGNLSPMDQTVVTLPVPSAAFWVGDGTNVFHVAVQNVNNGLDENGENNLMTSSFDLPKSYASGIRFRLRTNNYPTENSVKVWDAEGNVLLNQGGFAANSQYDFKMDYPDGCYTFELLDTGDDGLSYWADPGAGTGYLRILAPTVNAVLRYFESEFGRSIRFSFVLGMLTDQETVTDESPRVFFGPNPAVDALDIQTSGLSGPAGLTLVDVTGRIVLERSVRLPMAERIALPDLPSGVYGLFLRQDEWHYQDKVMILRP
ncbi:MAG: hypothetical protein K9I85_10260 [Saprospiraceae bacterium]|nr:hypothetical protein [Saprospiraceae bacterium]